MKWSIKTIFAIIINEYFNKFISFWFLWRKAAKHLLIHFFSINNLHRYLFISFHAQSFSLNINKNAYFLSLPPNK